MSFLFAKRYDFGCHFVSPPKLKVTPTIVPFSVSVLANKVEPPYRQITVHILHTGVCEKTLLSYIPVSVKKHSFRGKDIWEDKLSEHQIRVRIGVSAEGLQGKGSPKRMCFFTDAGIRKLSCAVHSGCARFTYSEFKGLSWRLRAEYTEHGSLEGRKS